MAKRIKRPHDITSYNKYGVSGGGENQKDRPDTKDSALEEYLASKSNNMCYIRDMSPYYLYSVKEVAVILRKAHDTIRKEALRTDIGIHKEGRYWFNSKEVEDLKKSFDQKRKDYLRRDKPEDESLIFALFQRLTKSEQILGNLIQDRERFRVILFEWMQNLMGRIEDLEKRK